MPRLLNNIMNETSGGIWIQTQEIRLVRPMEEDRWLVRLMGANDGKLTIVHESNIING